MELASLVRRPSSAMISFRMALISATLAAAWVGPALAQEAAEQPPVAADSAVPTAETESAVDKAGSDKTSNEAAPPADDASAAPTAGEETAVIAEEVEEKEGKEASSIPWEAIGKAAIVIALFVVPMVIGAMLAKQLRMPDHGWKFAVAIGLLAAAVVVIAMGEIKLGPDLSGGITLIYEIEENQDDQQAAAKNGQDATDERQPAGEDEANGELAEESDEPSGGLSAMSRDDKMGLLIKALTERVDPAGTKEVSIKKFGDGQIEIIIPKASDQELEAIERRIYTAGVLEFRITASPQFADHERIIALARALTPGQNIVRINGKEYARWVAYDQKQFGGPDEASQFLVVRTTGEVPQALVMTNDGLNVTGEYLRSAAPDVDQTGGPAVSFVFNKQGSFKFERLTRAHQPTPSGAKYQLGILLDNRLLSAPNLNAVISDRGIIEGLDDQDEVEFLVGILNAGSLPAALNKTPISRAQISPTLGKITVEKGEQALLASLVIIAAFMILYYRFAGFVACFALASNMLLIVGAMVLIKGAFTLPGLAGLVLTVGMSVDANVLIYERIREELQRGAALRMAIRNGYARAMSAIIDSNVTTLITAVVIYKIAPDNVKGFGITLIIGLFTSLFTAIFLTRLVFDVAEKLRLLKRLSMAQLVGATSIDFLRYRKFWVTVSVLVIAAGSVAVFARGRDMLDIDFTGGSSVTIVLDNDHKLDYAEVMKTLSETPLAKTNLSLVEVDNTNTRYTVTTINDDVEEVEKIIQEAFGDRLQTYHVDVENVAPLGSGGSQSSLDRFDGRLPASGRLLPGLPISRVALLQEASEETGARTTDEQPSAELEPATESSDVPEKTESAEGSMPTEPVAASDEPPAEREELDAPPADGAASLAQDPFAGGTSATLKFAAGGEAEEGGGVSHDVLTQLLGDALKAGGREDVAYELSNPEYKQGSIRNFPEWSVKIALPEAEARQVLERLQQEVNAKPVFPLSNKIGGRVAGRMAADAIAATLLSVAGIIAYVWFRFNRLAYALAAIVATIHDVLVTIGFLAFSAYLVGGSQPLASLLLVDKFQINLTLVAALLTIIGYSLNDTIVIFDRIREIKGKSPKITAEMINLAVNQTLSRTILTSLTTLMTVIVLYVLGGDGIHAFAYAMLIGVITGVYSTVYIATPVLLWLSERGDAAAAAAGAKAA